jgi:autotransporter-associated beta strand protein
VQCLRGNESSTLPRPRAWLARLAVALFFAISLGAEMAQAQNATWTGTTSSQWTTGTNWSTSTVPTGIATFTNNGAPNIIDISSNAAINEVNLTGSLPAPIYFVIQSSVSFSLTGSGVVNSSNSTSSFSSLGIVSFLNGSAAGNAVLTNNSGALWGFFNTSSAGNAAVLNSGSFYFYDSSTASQAGITNTNNLYFENAATAGSATIANNASATLSFHNTSTAGNATINNSGTVTFNDTSTAGSATITSNNSLMTFLNASTAGTAAITNNNGSDLNFQNTSTAGNATITNNNFSYVEFGNSSTAGSATIINNNALNFFNNSTGGNARIVNNAGGIADFSASTGPNGDGKLSAGSIEGAGNFYLGADQLTVGGNNLSTNVSGVISDCGIGGTACNQYGITFVSPTFGSLVKIGSGTMTLSGANTYTGPTTVNGGALEVDGSIASSSLTTVNNGATLQGIGTVGNTTIASGGMFAPGSGAPGSSMTVSGNLALASGALYMVQVNPATASYANVTGTATLGGSTVNATYANGSYVAKQYTILTAAGGVSGSFNTLVNTNLPANFTSNLSYDPTHAYLNLALNFTTPTTPGAGNGLNVNQQAVGNALSNFFNATGGIPLVFGTLTPAGLTQASGELATGTQQATFSAMNLFMGVMTDPLAGRSDPAVPTAAAASQFADEGDAATRQHSNAERDAYAAIYGKTPIADLFAQRWSVWAAGFGGSQITEGNAALGSNTSTSSVYGTAVGADYRISPFTVAGFALAGGGTNFSVANGGSGHSDLFQAGAFIRHTIGPAYISAALAYGWQDVTTDRTMTVAGIDQLRAQLNANALSGRLEGGYRFVAPWVGGIGITPYGAAQFTTFDLPAYSEQAIIGSNAFALAYNAKDVTDTRSELGIRTDNSWAMTDGILTLRGRLAWVHDDDPDRSIAATFQTLPGASFVVNGAAQASDSALVTASVEKKWLNGWSAAATFEGEFSDVTRSYAGKGVVRYQW